MIAGTAHPPTCPSLRSHPAGACESESSKSEQEKQQITILVSSELVARLVGSQILYRAASFSFSILFFSDALSFFAYLRSIFSSVSISFSIFVEATCCLLFLSEFFFLVRVLPPLPESGKRNGAGRSLLPDKSRYVFTYIYIIGVFHVGSLVG